MHRDLGDNLKDKGEGERMEQRRMVLVGRGEKEGESGLRKKEDGKRSEEEREREFTSCFESTGQVLPLWSPSDDR